MQSLRCRWTAALAILVIFATAASGGDARGSFGGFGRGFGGGHFGGFSGSHSFAPSPRPSFTPSPEPIGAPHPSFAVPSSTGSFGRAGNVGNPASNQFSASTNGRGSFGRTGAAGTRSFTSAASHPNGTASFPPAAPPYVGHPYTPTFVHPYYYAGRPVSPYFTGGYNDYSFGYYGHPYYNWSPWSPVFYFHPPVYYGGGYVSGGFSFFRLIVGIVFWIAVIAIVIVIVRSVARTRST